MSGTPLVLLAAACEQVVAPSCSPFKHTKMAGGLPTVAEDGLRKRTVNGQASKVVAPSEEGKKTDQKLDQHLEYVL